MDERDRELFWGVVCGVVLGVIYGGPLWVYLPRVIGG